MTDNTRQPSLQLFILPTRIRTICRALPTTTAITLTNSFVISRNNLLAYRTVTD